MPEVLLIVKDSDLRDTLAERLREVGYDVSAADDRDAARKSVKRRVPDIVISDQSEADSESDPEFLEEMARDRKLSRVPVVLLTAPGSGSSALSSYQCDIYAIFKKPVDIDQLLMQVETILRQTMRQQQSRKRERHELRSRILRLEREVSATTADLTDAAQNFVTMLATPPRPEGIRIDVHYMPSGGFIGGDFYDFFWLDERRLCVVVGDVTGHGIQAAVIQSMARKVISIGMRWNKGNIRDGLRFANDELADDIPHGKFVATLVGVLDVVSGHWQHARCGIPHPVLVRADGSKHDLLTAGVALGLRRSEDWAQAIEVYDTNIEPEGRIVMFSDGIIECIQDDGEEFDYKGVHKVLERAGPEDNVAEMMYQSAYAGHRADDDVLIIAITRKAIELKHRETKIMLPPDDEDPDIFARR
jgi:phosphoserine phosphatase RsbU/P